MNASQRNATRDHGAICKKRPTAQKNRQAAKDQKRNLAAEMRIKLEGKK